LETLFHHDSRSILARTFGSGLKPNRKDAYFILAGICASIWKGSPFICSQHGRIRDHQNKIGLALASPILARNIIVAAARERLAASRFESRPPDFGLSRPEAE